MYLQFVPQKRQLPRQANLSRVCLLIATASSLAAFGDVAHAADLDFVTVGAAGNRGTLPSERSLDYFPNSPVGQVDYEFRITRTPVVTSQWFEFVEAYKQFHQGPPNSLAFTSRWISRASTQNPPPYVYDPIAANYPVDVGFNYAARYCNWLHNNKVNEAWAFENGAYDMSLFYRNPDGSYEQQERRNPDARFWIPDMNEYYKAYYYDPNRFGVGQEGYWPHTGMSELPPIPGVTSNAGLFRWDVSVGQFPSVTSPWGLLDTSGGLGEQSETLLYGDQDIRQYIGATSWLGDSEVELWDALDTPLVGFSLVRTGFRVATIVPSPGSAVCVSIGAAWVSIRRRRTCDKELPSRHS
jgi:hypothetical protein